LGDIRHNEDKVATYKINRKERCLKKRRAMIARKLETKDKLE